MNGAIIPENLAIGEVLWYNKIKGGGRAETWYRAFNPIILGFRGGSLYND